MATTVYEREIGPADAAPPQSLKTLTPSYNLRWSFCGKPVNDVDIVRLFIPLLRHFTIFGQENAQNMTR